MTGTQLTFGQVEALWQQAANALYSSGQITSTQLTKALSATAPMAAISAAESALGANLGPSATDDYGLWQINAYYHPQYDTQSLLDNNFYNATAAVQVFLSQGFGAWSTWNNGAAQGYLSRAQSALGASGSFAPGTTSSVAAAPAAAASSLHTAPANWSKPAKLIVIAIASAMLFGGLYAARS